MIFNVAQSMMLFSFSSFPTVKNAQLNVRVSGFEPQISRIGGKHSVRCGTDKSFAELMKC